MYSFPNRANSVFLGMFEAIKMMQKRDAKSELRLVHT